MRHLAVNSQPCYCFVPCYATHDENFEMNGTRFNRTPLAGKQTHKFLDFWTQTRNYGSTLWLTFNCPLEITITIKMLNNDRFKSIVHFECVVNDLYFYRFVYRINRSFFRERKKLRREPSLFLIDLNKKK